MKRVKHTKPKLSPKQLVLRKYRSSFLKKAQSGDFKFHINRKGFVDQILGRKQDSVFLGGGNTPKQAWEDAAFVLGLLKRRVR